MIIKKALGLLCCAAAFFSSAQTNNSTTVNTNTANPGRGCGTPTLPAQFEAWVQSLGQTNTGKLGGGQTQSVFNIPVIVHVIHNNEALNSATAVTGGNLNAAQIYDQINILNRDFNGLNADTSLIPSVFKPVLGKFQFNFCLAVVNPTGGILAEPGIDRINRTTKGWNAPPYSPSYVTGTIKPNSIWDPTKYLNMWVMRLGGGLLGFATFPNPGTSGLSGIGPPYGSTSTDGLVMLNTGFGSIGTAVSGAPYDLGRTAVHELGHWLGLRHIWGDATCATDHCTDTPPAQGANYGCPAHPFNSGGCTGNTTGEMTMNYMDYTDDACMYMFTNDQKNRAQLIMTNSSMRVGLLTSTVCNTPTVTNEIGILYVTSPTYSQVINCNNYITPTVVIHNFGSNTVTSATFSYNVDGVGTQTTAWTGTLLPGSSSTVGMPGVTNLGNGPHHYNVAIYLPNGSADPNMTNNVNGQQFTIVNSFTIAAAGPTVSCSGNTITLTTGGGASSYTWYPGGSTATSLIVSPSVTTVYTITAKSGTCVNTRTRTVTVISTPTLSVNSPTHCAGTPTLLTVSGACTYTWMSGLGSGSSVGVNPSVTASYTVAGTACNGCQAITTTTVVTIPIPSVSVAVSPTGSLCPGGTATLTASGANVYNWNTGGTGNIITVSPTVNTVYNVIGSAGSCTAGGTALVTVGNNVLNINITPNPATVCAGGSLIISASGASTYTWTGGSNASSLSLTPLTPLTLTVTGTNGFCTSSRTVNVSIVQNPVVTLSGTSASVCAGTPLTLNAGGAASYTWNSGGNGAAVTVTPSVPSSYVVTGEQNGCTASASLAIGISGSTLNLFSSASPASLCAGGTTTLTAAGLTSYTWTGFSPGPQVVAPTAPVNSYTLTGFSGPCPATTVQVVTVAPSATFAASASPTTLCQGQLVVLTASGPYVTYQWLPAAATGSVFAASPSVSTVYTVVASGNNGCSRSNTVAVTVSSAPKAVLTTTNTACDEPCTGAVNGSFAGGTAPYSLSFSSGSCTALPCTGLCPGLYSILTKDAAGCVFTSYFSIMCYVKTGISGNENDLSVSMYPNPARSELTLQTEGEFSYSLYNDIGQLLKTKSRCFDETHISLEKLPAGLYLIGISRNDKVTYRKFIKE